MYTGHLKEENYIIFRLESSDSQFDASNCEIGVDQHICWPPESPHQSSLTETNNAMMLIYCAEQEVKSVIVNMNFISSNIKVDLNKNSIMKFQKENHLINHYYSVIGYSPYISIPWMSNNFILSNECYLDFNGVYYKPTKDIILPSNDDIIYHN